MLDERLNRALLANLVQTDLFAGNQTGWDAYVNGLQKDVLWFGRDLSPVADAETALVSWPATVSKVAARR